MSSVPAQSLTSAVCDSTMTQSSRKLVLIMGLVLFYLVLVLEVDPGGSSKIDKNRTQLCQARNCALEIYFFLIILNHILFVGNHFGMFSKICPSGTGMQKIKSLILFNFSRQFFSILSFIMFESVTKLCP